MNEICADEVLELSDADLEQVHGGEGAALLFFGVVVLIGVAAYVCGFCNGQADNRSKDGSQGKKG
jgi:hypothetical protein